MTSQNRLFCRQSARFLTTHRHNGKTRICVSHWISMIYTTTTKTTKNRRKIAGRKTRRFLRRFFNVKIVSYTPYSGLRLILFWHVFLRYISCSLARKRKQGLQNAHIFIPEPHRPSTPANTWQSFLKHPTTVKHTRNHHFFYPNPCTTQIKVVPSQHQNPQAS